MLKLGDKTIKSMYLGDTKIKKAYLGEKLVFETTPPKKQVGDIVDWAGYTWIVVNDNGDGTVVLAMDKIYELTVFGQNSKYEGSTLATKAKSFENSLPADALAQAVDTTVNGVTAKVFVASVEQVFNGGFEYFDSDVSRICHYNNKYANWWTSSVYGGNTNLVSAVYVDGAGPYNGNPSIREYGFRPFVTIKQNNAVFGVVWNYNNPSTALERLTVSSDPYKYVTNTPNVEPVAAVGNVGGSSPFDSFMPWMGMEEYNIVNNTVGAKQGESGFSRTANDVMVYIPEFWYKVVDDSSSKKRYFYISESEFSEFNKHPGSGKYVSRYTANSSYKSISGNQSVVSITRATARTNARNKGTGWQLYDFSSLCAVQLLYLVEYADWNSQAKVGRGYVDGNSAQINTGATDSMTYHTGIASGTNGKTAMQYRHIENMFGNIGQFIDGINFYERKAYVCLDTTKYADDTATNYIDTGITLPSSNNYIKGLGYSSNNDWLIIPNDSGGTDSTYIPDYVYSNTGWRVLYGGGLWANGSQDGAAYFNGNNISTFALTYIGVRLLYNP